MPRRLILAILTAVVIAVGAVPAIGDPATRRTPAPGPVRIIGGTPTGGCIAGAVALPETGPGYATIRMTRSDVWGAPVLIERIRTLALQLRAEGLPELLVGDISHPRGGPMGGGHVSHQRGLEVDIGLDMRPRGAMSRPERDGYEQPTLVRADRRGVEPGRWNKGVETLLRLSASLPGVDRVLVNPAIKKQLCDTVTGDRTWLRLIRPFYGHAAHLHLTLKCPADQPECRDLPPIAAGDGCDASLQWWFDQLDAPPAPPSGPPVRRKPPEMPEACKAVFSAR